VWQQTLIYDHVEESHAKALGRKVKEIAKCKLQNANCQLTDAKIAALRHLRRNCVVARDGALPR
jgi:hypothetical protein